MSHTYERAFSIGTDLPKPSFSYSRETSTIRVALSQSATTRQPEQSDDKAISLGIAEAESIDDANNDMDMLARQSFGDT